MKFVDHTGGRYKRLEALEYFPEIYKWLCVCDCGNLSLIRGCAFGRTKSCGCLNTELRKLRAKKMGRKWGPIIGKKWKKNLIEYSSSEKGRKEAVKLGKKYGPIYGPINGKLHGEDHMRFLGKKYGGKSSNTKYERIFASLLDEWNVRFLWNKETFPLGDGGLGGHYSLDFFLPKYNVDLELDGQSHALHVDRDARRDRYLLKEYDIRTIRIKNEDAMELTKNKLRRLICRVTSQ